MELKSDTFQPKVICGFGDINFGKQYRQGNRVYSSEYIATALMAEPLGNLGGYSNLYLVVDYGYKTTWNVEPE